MKPSLDHKKFLQQLYNLASGDFNETMDLLFAYIDDLLYKGRFADCDQLLEEVDLQYLNTYLIIGFLSTTRRATSVLKNRKSFVERARVRLTELAPDRIERLMSGLD